ncbi:MAG: TetR/AcrR family transcriptional regulator [Bdellovibrionales bacterium]
MSKRPGKNKENLKETHRVFLLIAREEFAEHGYAEASTSRIVQKSGMARGSLYYHFGDKNGLFKAVYEEIMYEGLDFVSNAMEGENDKWQALHTGIQAFLDLCLDHNFRKITLVESQAAMSFSERYAIHEKTLLGKLRELLPDLFEQGYFPEHTEDTISILLFGMLAETGRTLDIVKDSKLKRKIFGRAIKSTLNLMQPPKKSN